MIPASPASSSSVSGLTLSSPPGPQDRASLRPHPAPPLIRSSPSSAAARIGWPANPSPPLWSASIIVDGDRPFDRKTLETAGLLPASPHTVLYCSELTGDTPVARGLALLSEIRRRQANGEFSVRTPVLIFMHASMRSGELLLGDRRGRLTMPLKVLLHALSRELPAPDDGRAAAEPAPVVLSACEAGAAASSLQDFPRTVLINGGEHGLFQGDARAVFRSCLRIAEQGWHRGEPVPAARWFEQLAAVSGEVLHQTGKGEWVVHDPIASSSSLRSIGREQASLCVRAKLGHGSVDDLAEVLLLFGTAALEHEGSPPPMHHLLLAKAEDLQAKIVLLAALGVSVDQRDRRGNTLLHRLCKSRIGAASEDEEEGRIVLVRLLLANGADPEATDRAGRTPRELAARRGPPSLVAAFDPQPAAIDRPSAGPAGLRVAAAAQGWQSVLSLLDEPQQAMDVDEDDDDDGGGTEPALPATEGARTAAPAMITGSDAT